MKQEILNLIASRLTDRRAQLEAVNKTITDGRAIGKPSPAELESIVNAWTLRRAYIIDIGKLTSASSTLQGLSENK